MKLAINNIDVLAIIGYAIVLNQEMHSKQINCLNQFLVDYDLLDAKDIIYDVLGDVEDKIDLDIALKLYEKENSNAKEILYLLLYQLILLPHNSTNENDINSSERDFLLSIENYLSNEIIRKNRNIVSRLLKQKSRGNFTHCTDEFNVELDGIYTVAFEDFENMSEIVKRLASKCDELSKHISNIDIQNQKLRDALKEFTEHYELYVNQEVKQLKSGVISKELARNNFSIALMGRTKAGKSTLHSIMCKEGEEFIGKGGQRTTRFNRVFTWNGLKIIDTPGIGAGEDEGRRDEEIAESVINQADIICFVIVDDTISSEDILLTLDKIAEYHKPLIIVLNHKDDINKKSHLKRFETDPDKWKNTQDEKNLSGWIDRLERNAEKNGYKDIIRIVPVFLLAAIKGINEENIVYYQKSNYPVFVETIKELIQYNCVFYKSQTMLDEPSVSLHKAFDRLKEAEECLELLQRKIEEIYERTTKEIISLHYKIKRDCCNIIESEFEEFKVNYQSKFVDSNFMVKDIVMVKNNFKLFLEEATVLENISGKIQDVENEYHHQISDKIKELEEEIAYASLNIENLVSDCDSKDEKKTMNSFPIKGILKFVSLGLDVATLWFPPLFLISLPISIASNFFKSGNKKKDLNRTRTKEWFYISTDKSKNLLIKNIEKELIQTLNQDEKTLRDFFDNLQYQLNIVLNYIGECRQEFNQNLKELDKHYAIRILQFISKNECPLNINIADVIAYRDISKHRFEIRTTIDGEFDTAKIRELTGENVIVTKYQK